MVLLRERIPNTPSVEIYRSDRLNHSEHVVNYSFYHPQGRCSAPQGLSLLSNSAGVCGREPPEFGPPRCSAIAGIPEPIRSSRLRIGRSALYMAVLAKGMGREIPCPSQLWRPAIYRFGLLHFRAEAASVVQPSRCNPTLRFSQGRLWCRCLPRCRPDTPGDLGNQSKACWSSATASGLGSGGDWGYPNLVEGAFNCAVIKQSRANFLQGASMGSQRGLTCF